MSELKKEVLKYQLECLKIEIELVEQAITRYVSMAQTTKNWAIITWASSIALFFGQDKLRDYMMVTAFIPLLFWFIDAWWLHLWRGAVLRQIKISEFVNNGRLEESLEQGKLADFRVIDVLGEQYRGTEEYHLHTSMKKILLFKEIACLYGGLLIFSVIIHLFT